MGWGEFELIGWVKERFLPKRPGVTGIGDDAAIVPSEGLILATADAMVEGVHFIRGLTPWKDLGYKAVAVNVSDIAAMGGYPEFALLTLGLQGNEKKEDVIALFEGIREACGEFSLDLVGGDTVRSPAVFLSLSLWGKPWKKPLLRSAAQPGDGIFVSGPLGSSSIGLDVLLKQNRYHPQDREFFIRKHNRPVPQLALSRILSADPRVHAMMDLSDGLLGDLAHIADESGTGFEIDAERIPLDRQAYGPDPEGNLIEAGLHGGEDYALLFTASPGFSMEGVHWIGRILERERKVNFRDRMVDASELAGGYRHFEEGEKK